MAVFVHVLMRMGVLVGGLVIVRMRMLMRVRVLLPSASVLSDVGQGAVDPDSLNDSTAASLTH
ncbi:MAG TPA: hypothetical protein VMG58_12580 [Candidatus Sulfotelmatobacter sp.]|nr:hypothetical protein [Candidatus Sulfotelmatobacter sp.]